MFRAARAQIIAIRPGGVSISCVLSRIGQALLFGNGAAHCTRRGRDTFESGLPAQ